MEGNKKPQRLSAAAVYFLDSQKSTHFPGEKMDKYALNKLSADILDACLTVNREMVPGLIESIYELCLISEFALRKINYQSQVAIPLRYKGVDLHKDLRIDLLIANEIIIEIKSVDLLLPVHEAQIISYLKLANKNLGFLVNFNTVLLKHGCKRFVNNFPA